MNRLFMKALVVLALALTAWAGVAAQVEDQRGELRLYQRATQIGTVANRVFRDARGRVVKTIYYAGGGGLEGPYREELLREQSIEVNAYDDHDCLVKKERYAPGMRLLHTQETRCRPGTATPLLSTLRGPDGVRQNLTRHEEDGGSKTSLFFGDDGERIVAIDGDTPTDVDLAHGWGEEAGGFRVGIAPGRDRGRQQELRVWVTVKNVSHRAEGVVMVSVVALELRDAEGSLIPSRPEWAFDPAGAPPGACPDKDSRGAPFVGESDLLRSYDLGEYFGRLAPGKYSASVTHCLSTTKALLASNTIHIEVE